MHRIDSLSKAQRVVVVIALGLGLSAVGSYVIALAGSHVGGNFAAPADTGLFYPPGVVPGLRGWLILVIWLVLVGAWALASLRVLRPASDDAASD
jgi:hypothetical protein